MTIYLNLATFHDHSYGVTFARSDDWRNVANKVARQGRCIMVSSIKNSPSCLGSREKTPLISNIDRREVGLVKVINALLNTVVKNMKVS